jgi:16S rRNA (adenine1518-N6/adenine1519-N6)-dimethyltransferase
MRPTDVQTLTEIRDILKRSGLRPQRRFGQNFLIDKNLMGKLLETGELTGTETVLEVGAGTGSLTEELLSLARRVVAAEIDRGMCEQLRRTMGDRENLVVICGDVLSSKHAISPVVLDALGKRAVLVANLPYGIATPLVAQCLLDSWRGVCIFDRLTFTVQREVAERMTAAVGGPAYGPISVLVSLLSRATLGCVVPASAFWPAPKVAGRIVRIDFDTRSASRIADIDVLTGVVRLAFNQRRKQIGTIFRGKRGKLLTEDPDALRGALSAAGIDERFRPQQISPEAFAALAHALVGRS